MRLVLLSGDPHTFTVACRPTSVERRDGSEETFHSLHHRVTAGRDRVSAAQSGGE